MKRNRVRGFTLLELMVALATGGMALAGAAALLYGIGEQVDRLVTVAERVDRDANAERLLRTLFANLELSADTTPSLIGDAQTVRFGASCPTAEGWLGRCGVRLSADAGAATGSLHLELTAAGAEGAALGKTVLAEGFEEVGIRYLVDPRSGGTWVTSWSRIGLPAAVALIVEGDTLLLNVWGGG